ncbi:vWA domain-containing protein [Paraburkholderia rhizosphaerae]|uniref:MxaL protein n=1 Tax=Paraburkholderia rhizosphaerae TaxID=480658 RepID=A0A4R8LYM8_9BURK|nr:vWA domain-containing protein [Paraburkholderia rhizosphaerae]TDY51796.1 mxaL protein [Paraburkholderia rhizosphaerae]
MTLAGLDWKGLLRRHALLGAAALLLVAAVWMPPVEHTRLVARYIVTFDITQSMDTEDLTLDGRPVSRLAFAKTAMQQVLQQLPCGSRVGWSVFTGTRSLLLFVPVDVCAHYDALLSSLDEIGGRMRWADSSVIAQGGIYSAVQAASQPESKAAVIFVTDGQEAPPVSPSETMVHGIAQGQADGWIIGVGGDQPAPIPRTNAQGERSGYWRADEVVQSAPTRGGVAGGHEQLSELREPYLRALAAHTGFGYRRLDGFPSLYAAMSDPRLGRRLPVATDFRWCPALAALLLLVLRFLPRRSTGIATAHRDAGADLTSKEPLTSPSSALPESAQPH